MCENLVNLGNSLSYRLRPAMELLDNSCKEDYKRSVNIIPIFLIGNRMQDGFRKEKGT